MNRTKRIVIRVTEEELAKVVRIAGGNGKVSALVRERILDADGRTGDPKEKLRLLAMANNNLFALALARRENRIDDITVLTQLISIERSLKDHLA